MSRVSVLNFPVFCLRKQAVGGRPPRYASAPASCIYSPGGTYSGMLAFKDISNKLTFDLLILKLVSESRVTWVTSVPISVFVGLSVFELGPMYATDRRQTKASINASTPLGAEA